MPASMGADPDAAAIRRCRRRHRWRHQAFGDETAVDAMRLVVTRGTIVGVIGPSGSGKTTTIRLLTGALAPTSGTVRVLGEDPRRFRRSTRERIGYMPQQFTLYPDLTARENVDFVASLFGMLMFRRRRRDEGGTDLRRPVGRPRPQGVAALGRDAAPPGTRLRARPRTVAPVPRRADRRDRPDAARPHLGGAPPLARRRPDDAGHDPVRQRGRVVRHRRPHLRRPAHRPGHAR